ncbi:MAG: hypothetical protein HUJ51_04825 [Eggerthellaceae bacterium]|nr:hypothetical protein [Eggerthellaceae bacterium]
MSEDGISVYLKPCTHEFGYKFANVNDVYNASLLWATLGKVLMYRKGVGADPVVSFVVADIVNVHKVENFNSLPLDNIVFGEMARTIK